MPPFSTHQILLKLKAYKPIQDKEAVKALSWCTRKVTCLESRVKVLHVNILKGVEDATIG